MTTTRRPQHVWYVKGFRIFSHLPKPQRARLERSLKLQRVKPGTMVYPGGQIPRSVFLLRKGAVEIARLGPRGRKVGRAVVGPGEVFGCLGFLEGEGWPHVATALEACELWQVPAREFRRLCRYHPDFILEVAEPERQGDPLQCQDRGSALQTYPDQAGRYAGGVGRAFR